MEELKMKIVEYFSPTCIPCKILKSRLESLKQDYPEVDIQFVNVIENPTKGIQGVPHLWVQADTGEILINERVDLTVIKKLKDLLDKNI